MSQLPFLCKSKRIHHRLLNCELWEGEKKNQKAQPMLSPGPSPSLKMAGGRRGPGDEVVARANITKGDWVELEIKTLRWRTNEIQLRGCENLSSLLVK